MLYYPYINTNFGVFHGSTSSKNGVKGFWIGGSVVPEGGILVKRKIFDRINSLLSRSHVAIAGPRQSGKSTLLKQLAEHHSKSAPALYLSLEGVSGKEKEYYSSTTFVADFLRLLNEAAAEAGLQSLVPDDEGGLRAVFNALPQRCRLFLDEHSSVSLANPGFLHALRSVLEMKRRDVRVVLGDLSHKSQYADGYTSSPFNIAENIRLGDFSFQETVDFVNLGFHVNGFSCDLSDLVYFWSGGDPYLTNKLGIAVVEHAQANDIKVITNADVNGCATRIVENGNENRWLTLIKYLQNELQSDVVALRDLRAVLHRQPLPFYEQGSVELLAALGFITSSHYDDLYCISSGNCVPRNKMTEMFLRRYF